jgi:hypothetical protein
MEFRHPRVSRARGFWLRQINFSWVLVGKSMFNWWRKREYRQRLAQEDATILIARYGVRASHIANHRMTMMRNGSVFDSNRPSCHWKRVHSITRQLLPYDGEDGPDGLLKGAGP